jgi:hypothetical protein
MLGVRSGIGLEDLLVGRKLSSRTSTKLEGNKPIDRLSLHSLPIHHDPSPALRHSIRSPSTNPRSRLDYFSQHIENFGVPNAITYFTTKTVHRADPTRESGGYIPWGCHVEIRRKDTVLSAPEVFAPPPRSLTRRRSFKLKGRDMQVPVEAAARMYER